MRRSRGQGSPLARAGTSPAPRPDRTRSAVDALPCVTRCGRVALADSRFPWLRSRPAILSLYLMEGAAPSVRYDVALSFAGEQREYVEHVARCLRRQGLSVFYDKDEAVELWGKNLTEHLLWVYRDGSRRTVVFISKEYAQKAWTRLERRAAQERAFRERTEYILPVRFDDTPVPELFETVAYLDARTISPQRLCTRILQKLGAVPARRIKRGAAGDRQARRSDAASPRSPGSSGRATTSASAPPPLPDRIAEIHAHDYNLIVARLGVVGLPDHMSDIINHQQVQRLRFPKYDYLDLIYPSSASTWLDLSIRTYAIARQMIAKLWDAGELRDPDVARASIVAALLGNAAAYPLHQVFSEFAAAQEMKRYPYVDVAPPWNARLLSAVVSPPAGDVFASVVNYKLKVERSPAVRETLADVVGRSYGGLLPLIHEITGELQPTGDTARIGWAVVNAPLGSRALAAISAEQSLIAAAGGATPSMERVIESLSIARDESGNVTVRTEPALHRDLQLASSVVNRARIHSSYRAVCAMHAFVIADLIRSDKFSFPRYFGETLFASHWDATAMLHRWYSEVHGTTVASPLSALASRKGRNYKSVFQIRASSAEEASRLHRLSSLGPLARLDLAERIRVSFSRAFPWSNVRYGDIVVDVTPPPSRDLLPTLNGALSDRDVDGAPSEVLAELSRAAHAFRVFVRPDVAQGLVSRLTDATDVISAAVEGAGNGVASNDHPS